jgi:hypothetical protein
MAAVVLQGPEHAAPEVIVGPFDTMIDAQRWAAAHPREGGYSVPVELTPVPGSGGRLAKWLRAAARGPG